MGPGSTTLSEEVARAIADVRGSFKAEFELMEQVRLFVEMVTVGPLTVAKSSRIDEGVLLVVRGLLAKTCKTLRAVQAVAGVGCGQDAAILLRAMFESSAACSWILQRNRKRRAVMFAAHEDQRHAVEPTQRVTWAIRIVRQESSEVLSWMRRLGPPLTSLA